MNTNGHSPKKFLEAKTVNSLTLISFVDLPMALLLTRPTSSAKVLVRRENPQSLRLEATQHDEGSKQTLKNLTQFIFSSITPVLGSKVLNNLLIC